MTEYLLDTWAWIEYYEGSEIGELVDEKLENSHCYTSIVSLAELSDNFHNKDKVTNYRWEHVRKFIATNSDLIQITKDIAGEAGKIKAEEREEKPGFGLMDALILATAKENDLKLLTGDPHLVSKEETVDLKK